MSKANEYFLVSRDINTNQFKIVPIKNHRSSSLEEIDLFTTSFQNEKELTSFLKKKKIIDRENNDFFIVNQKKINNKKVLNIQEVLYSNAKAIKRIANHSKEKQLFKSIGDIDAILDGFAVLLKKDKILWGQVVSGKTNVYEKYANYFINGNNIDLYSIKYRDGCWARNSYPLIRNILEAEGRNTKKQDTIERDMYRSLIDEKLFIETDSNYADHQITMFEIIPEEKEQEDKLLEVMTYFENLPKNVFIRKDDEARFNPEYFSSCEKEDLEKLIYNLPERLQYTLQLLATNKEIYKESYFLKNSYQIPIKQGQNTIIRMLKSNRQVLEKAYEWCKLFEKYNNKKLGEVNGRGYQKEY